MLPRSWFWEDVCNWVLSDDVLIQDRSLSFGMICHPVVKPHVCFDNADHPFYTILTFDWFQRGRIYHYEATEQSKSLLFTTHPKKEERVGPAACCDFHKFLGLPQRLGPFWLASP